MIKAMDQHRDASVRFEKGALAWLDSSECPIPGDHHFKLPWAGPFKILDTSPSTATLELPSHWQLRSNVFHFNKLRPFRARPPSFGPSLPSPPSPIVRRGQTYYVVDRIVNHRRVGRKGRDGLRLLQYKVRWKGYSEAYDQWIPATRLKEDGLLSEIRAYHRTSQTPVESF